MRTPSTLSDTSNLNSGKTDVAIAVLTFNVNRFPASSNAYDSLGEALMRAGRIDESILTTGSPLNSIPGMTTRRSSLRRWRRKRRQARSRTCHAPADAGAQHAAAPSVVRGSRMPFTSQPPKLDPVRPTRYQSFHGIVNSARNRSYDFAPGANLTRKSTSLCARVCRAAPAMAEPRSARRFRCGAERTRGLYPGTRPLFDLR